MTLTSLAVGVGLALGGCASPTADSADEPFDTTADPLSHDEMQPPKEELEDPAAPKEEKAEHPKEEKAEQPKEEKAEEPKKEKEEPGDLATTSADPTDAEAADADEAADYGDDYQAETDATGEPSDAQWRGWGFRGGRLGGWGGGWGGG
ncbi:MAG: hypothetical protein KIS78_30510, partial [Labilithrix sp.]|nr:hypothetical protein [Labilithrix sp.]